MDDYISRNKALAETWKNPTYTDPLNVLTEIRDRLRVLPAADVQPVRHGHWEDKYGLICCSLCGDPWAVDESTMAYSFNYCPNCGARMDGEQNG